MSLGRINKLKFLSAALVGFACLLSFPKATAAPQARVNIRVIADEADAVLTILAKRKANQTVTDADWQRIFSSEGYVRLKKRETSLKRSFDDSDFKTFVLSDELLERAEALVKTLGSWKTVDATRAAQLALAYLPESAQINAKIYPVIKPRDNSFVFDIDTDPAIFLYLDPTVTKQKFENTLAHELHHIGYGTACPTKETSAEIERLPKPSQTVIRYIGAFGEGFAMLAAAGGPNIHPHMVSEATDRARWDRDVENFNADLKKVEQFFLDVLANKLSEEQIDKTVGEFFGEQGPWYTVGWKMCVLIEKTFGRRALIDAMCDQRKLLPLYNRAATQHNDRYHDSLPTWSQTLISAML
jgi:hypothetical protein